MPSLSSHPIFRIDKGAYKSFNNDARRNVVAFKGTEVYVAVGPKVRCADLRGWYAMEEEPQDGIHYQTLEYPSVTFEIEELLWNTSGTHLALVGKHDLAIVTFPRLGLTSHIKSDTIPPKVSQIGKDIYNSTNVIQKVQFHPRSKHDNTLVILSTDSHLRVFELTLSPHVPEQDIPLFPSPKRGYTVDFDIPVPVTFAFGVGTDWLIWTVFILTRDGDIYLLCPILPTKCILSRPAITRMKALISYRAQVAFSKQESCSLIERETCLNQTRWISDILGQISMGEFMGVASSPAFTGIDNGDMVSFKRPNKVRPTPQLQGPVLFQPAPQPIDNIFPEASDLMLLDADGVGIVVTTWHGGRVDVGILIDEIEGIWNVKGVSKDELDTIKVAVYESIDLPVAEVTWTGILASHNGGEGVFIVGDGRMWQIDFRGWVHELQKMSQDDNDEDHEPFKAKPSILDLVVKESPDIVVGYGLLFDPLLDYHILTISSACNSKFTELALPNVSNLSLDGRSPSSAQSRRTTKPATYLAYPFPDDTFLESPGRSVRAGLRIPPYILREKDPHSADAIKALGDVTVRIRNTVGSVLRVGEGLRRRLELQHKELAAQLSKLSSTYGTIQQLEANALFQAERFQSVKQTQIELESRANMLLRKLLMLNQPQTSDAEERWFKELTRVQSRLNGQRGLLAEVKLRIAEGRKFVELAGKKDAENEEVGKRKLDGRVMEVIEEATRKVERLKMRTARLSSGL